MCRRMRVCFGIHPVDAPQFVLHKGSIRVYPLFAKQIEVLLVHPRGRIRVYPLFAKQIEVLPVHPCGRIQVYLIVSFGHQAGNGRSHENACPFLVSLSR